MSRRLNNTLTGAHAAPKGCGFLQLTGRCGFRPHQMYSSMVPRFEEIVPDFTQVDNQQLSGNKAKRRKLRQKQQAYRTRFILWLCTTRETPQVGQTVAQYRENAMANPMEFLQNWMQQAKNNVPAELQGQFTPDEFKATMDAFLNDVGQRPISFDMAIGNDVTVIVTQGDDLSFNVEIRGVNGLAEMYPLIERPEGL